MNYQKYANTYKNGEIISKKDENGITRDYTIQEVEELIDKLSEDKDENGKVKDPESLNNAVAILMQLYRKYGNPHEKEILEAIRKSKEEKPIEEQKQEALEEVLNEVEQTKDTTETIVGEVTDENEHLVDIPGEDAQIVVGNGILDQIKSKDSENIIKLDSDHEDEYVDFEEITEDDK